MIPVKEQLVMRCWQLNLHSGIALECQVHFYRRTG